MSTPASLTRFVILGSLVASGLAAAEARRPAPQDKPVPRYVRTPGAAVPPGTSAVTSRIVYLHRCSIGSCNVRSGPNDSRADTSTIADGIKQLTEFTHGDETWNAMVECVKTTFAPFNITITTQDPGTTTPHFENMIGGRISDLTSDPDLQNSAGVAPFDCGEIPNAIVYTFDNSGPDYQKLCWTSAQEIAHAFGLEHMMLQKDPLTYLDGDLPKRFRDEAGQCGEYALAARCGCGGTTQNTYRRIVGMFGVGAPTPPDVLFKRPVEGKQVQPGFQAVIDAQDDVRVEKVDLYVDGVMIGTTSTPIAEVYEIATADIAPGEHTLEARATDVQGTVGTQTIAITMGPPCTPDKGCTGSDVCVSGVCIPGPEEPGGLGSICQSDTECLSHQCADAGESRKYCVEACAPSTANSCPGGFSCIQAGGGGVCWPESGGCCDAGGSGRGPILLGLGVMVALTARRRRRR